MTDHEEVERAEREFQEGEALIDALRAEWLEKNPDESLKPGWYHEEYPPAQQNRINLQMLIMRFQYLLAGQLRFPVVELVTRPNQVPRVASWPDDIAIMTQLFMNMAEFPAFHTVWGEAFNRLMTLERRSAALAVLLDAAFRHAYLEITGTDIDDLPQEDYKQ